MTNNYFDRPDSYGGVRDNIVHLGGHEINLDHVTVRERVILEQRYLFKTLVYLDRAEYQALIIMYDNKFVLIVARVNPQQNTLRKHSWTYKQIKSITTNSRNDMLLTVENEDQENREKDQELQLLFSSKLECDQFEFRFKILSKIYKYKSPPKVSCPPQLPTEVAEIKPSTSTGIYHSCPPKIPKVVANSCSPSNRLEMAPNGHNNSAAPMPMDDLFSVENLQKLATASPEKLILPDVKMAPTPHTKPPVLKEMITNQLNGAPKLVSTKNIKVPVELDAGQAGKFTLDAEAKISFHLNLDLVAIQQCLTIKDKEERLNKIRQYIHLETSVCELKLV